MNNRLLGPYLVAIHGSSFLILRDASSGAEGVLVRREYLCLASSDLQCYLERPRMQYCSERRGMQLVLGTPRNATLLGMFKIEILPGASKIAMSALCVRVMMRLQSPQACKDPSMPQRYGVAFLCLPPGKLLSSWSGSASRESSPQVASVRPWRYEHLLAIA
jgi:hypothetical protein